MTIARGEAILLAGMTALPAALLAADAALYGRALSVVAAPAAVVLLLLALGLAVAAGARPRQSQMNFPSPLGEGGSERSEAQRSEARSRVGWVPAQTPALERSPHPARASLRHAPLGARHPPLKGRDTVGSAQAAVPLFALVASIAGLLLLGPRVGLPAFALVFARTNSAGWGAALAVAAACAALIELVLVRLLGQPIPLLPLLAFLPA